MEKEKQKLKDEIEQLKIQQKEMREKLKEIERLERLKNKERCDIASKLENSDMLDFVFEFYDNVCDFDRKMTGKVTLRHWKQMPHGFATIRNLAKGITDYKIFTRRRDDYVEQTTVKRNLNQLDDIKINLVTQCADEIIAVLYKYKKFCEKHQDRDYSEYVLESEERNAMD